MRFLLALAFLLATTLAAWAQAEEGWPRARSKDGSEIVMYQPQIDDWKSFATLDGRMAIAVTPKDRPTQVGVVTFQMKTAVDMDSHTVLLTDPQITGTHFPGLDPDKSAELDRMVRGFLPPSVAMTMSLDHLIAGVKKPPAHAAHVRNDPPAIFISFQPAILLHVDGAPVRAPVKDSDLSFVVNSNWPLFRDESAGAYYLFTGQWWMKGPDLPGPWAPVPNLPDAMEKVPHDPNWGDLAQYIPAHAGDGPPPSVYYTAGPAELIIFKGSPAFAPIPGTQLTYATNTDSDVFVYAPSHTYYYLTSGRWFSSVGPTGPWVFATDSLPADFAAIPEDSPAARVLASVPGTPEAEDAVLLAQVPTRASVNPTAAAAKVKVSYSGEPQFRPIEGTELFYAANTPDKVIRVGDRYYLCLDGVWFVAGTPEGPWETARSVPEVIYTIPPSSPYYNVTYVTQTVAPDGAVEASYTAGYLGVFVAGAALGAIVAEGTGYYYPPYVGPPVGYYHPYYPYASTYGAATFYNPYTGATGVVHSAYGPYGGAEWGSAYNPATGTYARGATAYGPYGQQSVAQAYNPYTGAYGATHQGSNAYAQWGNSEVTRDGETAYAQHYSTAQGTEGSIQTSQGGAAAGVKTQNGGTAAAKTENGDMYADHDGNVYKNTGDGWQKYDSNGNWSNAQQPQHTTTEQKQSTQYQQKPENTQQHTTQNDPYKTANNSAAARPPSDDMSRDWQSRQRGTSQSQRFDQFQRSRGGFGGGGGTSTCRFNRCR